MGERRRIYLHWPRIDSWSLGAVGTRRRARREAADKRFRMMIEAVVIVIAIVAITLLWAVAMLDARAGTISVPGMCQVMPAPGPPPKGA